LNVVCCWLDGWTEFPPGLAAACGEEKGTCDSILWSEWPGANLGTSGGAHHHQNIWTVCLLELKEDKEEERKTEETRVNFHSVGKEANCLGLF
jgi:hypothetical protein